MNELILFLGLAGFVSSWLILRSVRAFSLNRGLLAIPNERSSHARPTPSMGGIALVVPVLAFGVYAAFHNEVLGLVIFAGGLPLAIVGLVDDVRGVSSWIRFLVHVFVAALTWWLMPLSVVDSLPVFSLFAPYPASAISALGMVLAMVWLINLTNFMDGTDGLAGSQCLFFCLGVFWLTVGVVSEIEPILWLLAGGSLAFLTYNWPPAKIFMGDVGSGFLGFLFSVAILQLVLIEQLVPFVTLLILLTVFWVDASYTLCVRMVTRQAFTTAHRSHLYQILARRYNHERVVQIFWVYSLVWLLPLAWLSFRYVGWGLAWLLLACFPIVVACIRYRAGMSEQIRESDRAR